MVDRILKKVEEVLMGRLEDDPSKETLDQAIRLLRLKAIYNFGMETD